jgi:hypothetical protein
MKRGLGLEECKANEVAAPLREMHGVLRDVAVQLLLEGVRSAAEALAAPGSRWHRHVQVERAQVLKPGLRVVYWTSADVVLLEGDEISAGSQQQKQQQQQRQLPGASGRPLSRFAAAGAGGSGGGSSSKDRGDPWRKLLPRPAVEVGVGEDGLVQVLHLPHVAGGGGSGQEGLQLQLNTHRVDVEALLLQSARMLANRQLRVVLGQLQQQLQRQGLSGACQLRLLQPSQASAAKADLQLPTQEIGSIYTQEQQEGGVLLTGGADGWMRKGADVVQQQQQQEVVVQPLLVPDVLDIGVGGSSLMRVTYRGWSGQLVIRPGATQGGERNLGAVAQTLQVRGRHAGAELWMAS